MQSLAISVHHENHVNPVKLLSFAVAIKIFILACCLLTHTSATYAQSVSRPRMLIGENDPLTGFKVLRARYEAGARPSDDMDGWALTYLLTGGEKFAKRAIHKVAE